MADTQFKYDVFISYNHADEKWVVDTLLPALESAGLKVCIDYKDLGAGEIASVGMEKAIETSHAMLLVLTQNWFKGKWTHYEAQIAVNLDPSGKTRKIIPLICEAGIEKEIPQAIGRYNRIDFVKNQALAWRQLLVALDKSEAPLPDSWKSPVRIRWFYGHRYGDLENFTGRATEMKMLDEWLNNDNENLLVLRALGGFGKSALTWQWFNNKVDKAKWQTAVWWSFYEKESGFESFLSETLNHLGVEVKASARLQLNDLLEAMRGTNILIVLDGFERLLRQYGRMDAALQSDDEDADIDPSQRDCSSPLTETFLRGLSGAGMKSKVLMTTRLCPRVLESADGVLLKGCREEPLAAFSPEDAVTYFHNEGIKATRAEIVEACAAYGYHPLSLSLLVGLINADHERRGDIVVVKNLEIFEDVKARRHHVLERAYGSLALERRDLLSKMSCFRGSMEYAVLKKVFPSPDLDKALLDLRKRGLILETRGLETSQPNSHLVSNHLTSVFDMHPIVRHYAYKRLKGKGRIHIALANYFVERWEDQFLDLRIAQSRHLDGPVCIDSNGNEAFRVDASRDWLRSILLKKEIKRDMYRLFTIYGTDAKTLQVIWPAIEGFYHAVRAGKYEQATEIFSDLLYATLEDLGAFQLQIELMEGLIDSLGHHSHNQKYLMWASGIVAEGYALIGQPNKSLHHSRVAMEIAKTREDKNWTKLLLYDFGTVEISLGLLRDASEHLSHYIQYEELQGNYWGQIMALLDIGLLSLYRGEWEKAKEHFDYAADLSDSELVTIWYGMGNKYDALWSLIILRAMNVFPDLASNLSKKNLIAEASENSKSFLTWVNYYETNRRPNKKALVWAHFMLGSAYRMNDELTLAEENLSKALNLCRQINMVLYEADILLDLARLRYAQGDFKDAQEKASEALVITERSGYVLQGADVNLFLATLALEGYKLESFKDLSNKDAAIFHAKEAKKLATGWEEIDGKVVYDTTGKYVYKVAYDEAEAMLEKLK